MRKNVFNPIDIIKVDKNLALELGAYPRAGIIIII